jgi:tetratricopeptide (TPR) repeat protein
MRVEGIHVLRVAGSFHDMGFQHGRLLRDAIPEGPVPYYRTYCEKLLRRAGLGPVASLAMSAIRAGVSRRIIAAFPPFVRETVSGFAEGAGMSEREAMEAFTMPDTLMWIAANAIRLSRCGPAERHRLAQQLGCSSAFAWGAATADGKLYHARNLDYHGVEPWTRAQAVIFHAPERGQRYVSVTAAGIPLGGHTAMNEAGLSLAVHQHMFTDATALGGTPIGCVGDIVMREAETLEDAERILSSHTPIGCWTYLVADGRRGEVLVYEENPGRRASFRARAPEATTLGYANVYRDASLGRTERDLYGSYWRANHGRDARVKARLAEGRGRLDAAGMAAILADTGAPADGCRLSSAVAMLLTVGSVVFSPGDGRFWVGTGEAPTSHGRFIPFDLAREDHAPGHGALEAGPDAASDAARAFEAYRRAYVAYMDRDDLGGARAHMRWAVTLAPREALYHALEGLLAVKALDAALAKGALERALAIGHAHRERAAEFRLWLGRAHDLLGERALALEDYRAALEAPHDPPVGRAAREGLSRAYTSRRARRVAVDFAFADVIAP